MAKRFSKSTETRDELQVPAILCQDALSAPDATSLHHCLNNKQLKTSMVSEVRIQVFSITYI